MDTPKRNEVTLNRLKIVLSSNPAMKKDCYDGVSQASAS